MTMPDDAQPLRGQSPDSSPGDDIETHTIDHTCESCGEESLLVIRTVKDLRDERDELRAKVERYELLLEDLSDD